MCVHVCVCGGGRNKVGDCVDVCVWMCACEAGEGCMDVAVTVKG